MQRLRIAIVTETYPPEVNGVARTVALIAEGLRARDHEIQVVRPRQNRADQPRQEPGYSEELCAGFPIPRYPQLRMGLPAKAALASSWRTRRPDVVHIATEGPLGWSALGAARALGIPVATDFHTNFHAYSGHYGIAWLARPVMAWLRRFHNRADCTIVPTDELARALEGDGFERLRVAGRGVDAAVFSPAKRSAELRAQWGAGDDTPVALCVSRFAPEKNFPMVMEAFRAMRAAQPETRLVLVGDGPMREALERERLGPVIAGRLVNGALSAHYASADVFLFPSLTETFGNVTLEAMASGLAVVAYDYAAARQHIVHGRSGVLAPPGDRAAFLSGAAQLALDLGRARAIGRRAREAAAQVSWERITGDFEAILLETARAAEVEARHAAA
ncbi:MAG TPA: glycosyltransferase family 1 protein [Burkholderiales bacterium]|nr:glycosyltransferase family 1 protein [Burkholderiales bacterium]